MVTSWEPAGRRRDQPAACDGHLRSARPSGSKFRFPSSFQEIGRSLVLWAGRQSSEKLTQSMSSKRDGVKLKINDTEHLNHPQRFGKEIQFQITHRKKEAQKKKQHDLEQNASLKITLKYARRSSGGGHRAEAWKPNARRAEVRRVAGGWQAGHPSGLCVVLSAADMIWGTGGWRPCVRL